jgi:hypothetical protein
MNVDEENNRGGQPKQRAADSASPDRGVYRSCGTFLYQERLQQQNGDIRKREGVKTMCIWLAFSTRTCLLPPLSSFPPPPLTSLQMRLEGQPACAHFRPPSPSPPPQRIIDRFWQPRPKSRMASILETVNVLAEFGQHQ